MFLKFQVLIYVFKNIYIKINRMGHLKRTILFILHKSLWNTLKAETYALGLTGKIQNKL